MLCCGFGRPERFTARIGALDAQVMADSNANWLLIVVTGSMVRFDYEAQNEAAASYPALAPDGAEGPRYPAG